jgi:hypothetical protein
VENAVNDRRGYKNLAIANAEPDRNSFPPDPAGSASFY